MGYQCRSCGQFHDGPPSSYIAIAPFQYYIIPENERKRRVILSSDQCEIDRKYFFIIGNIDIPIIDSKDMFTWSVWISLSKDNYQRTGKLWKKAERLQEPPYFGWLSTRLAVYPDTLNLKTNVHTRQVGLRPFVELERTNHPLAIEQRIGISKQRVQEIAEIMLHKD